MSKDTVSEIENRINEYKNSIKNLEKKLEDAKRLEMVNNVINSDIKFDNILDYLFIDISNSIVYKLSVNDRLIDGTYVEVALVPACMDTYDRLHLGHNYLGNDTNDGSEEDILNRAYDVESIGCVASDNIFITDIIDFNVLNITYITNKDTGDTETKQFIPIKRTCLLNIE